MTIFEASEALASAIWRYTLNHDSAIFARLYVIRPMVFESDSEPASESMCLSMWDLAAQLDDEL